MLASIFPADLLELLPEVESGLQDHVQSQVEELHAWVREPVQAGGKRVRPLLLLTSYKACGGDQRNLQQAIDAAVAIELVHTASLVHDDLMDRSQERRGAPSTYAAHGVDAAILAGDYLFIEAFALAAKLPREAHELTADACRRLCEGQVREQAVDGPDRQRYRDIIRDKTASLLTAACGIGATLAQADAATVEAMQTYGQSIGYAFQVLDDVLDVTGDPNWTGKPSGTDYVAGTTTSPYLHHMERGGTLPATRHRSDFPQMSRRLHESGAVAASQMEAATYTQHALLALQGVPPSDSRDSLTTLATRLMERMQ